MEKNLLFLVRETFLADEISLVNRMISRHWNIFLPAWQRFAVYSTLVTDVWCHSVSQFISWPFLLHWVTQTNWLSLIQRGSTRAQWAHRGERDEERGEEYSQIVYHLGPLHLIKALVGVSDKMSLFEDPFQSGPCPDLGPGNVLSLQIYHIFVNVVLYCYCRWLDPGKGGQKEYHFKCMNSTDTIILANKRHWNSNNRLLVRRSWKW